MISTDESLVPSREITFAWTDYSVTTAERWRPWGCIVLSKQYKSLLRSHSVSLHFWKGLLGLGLRSGLNHLYVINVLCRLGLGFKVRHGPWEFGHLCKKRKRTCMCVTVQQSIYAHSSDNEQSCSSVWLQWSDKQSLLTAVSLYHQHKVIAPQSQTSTSIKLIYFKVFAPPATSSPQNKHLFSSPCLC